MKRKVLIAVPDSGSAKAKETATLAKKFFREFSKYDTLSTTDNYESYPLALGQSISVLVQMDMLILMAGWMTDIMCLSLHDVATRHGITIMTEDEFMASHSISFGEFATNYLNNK